MKDMFIHLGGLSIGKFYYELMYVENPQVFWQEENQNRAHEKSPLAF